MSTSQHASLCWRPWWSWLPGMAWQPARAISAADAETINRTCAMACAVRLMHRGEHARDEMNRLAGQARDLRDWLRKAGTAEEAWLRRLTLCQLADVVPPGTDLRQLRDLAVALLAP